MLLIKIAVLLIHGMYKSDGFLEKTIYRHDLLNIRGRLSWTTDKNIRSKKGSIVLTENSWFFSLFFYPYGCHFYQS